MLDIPEWIEYMPDSQPYHLIILSATAGWSYKFQISSIVTIRYNLHCTSSIWGFHMQVYAGIDLYEEAYLSCLFQTTFSSYVLETSHSQNQRITTIKEKLHESTIHPLNKIWTVSFEENWQSTTSNEALETCPYKLWYLWLGPFYVTCCVVCIVIVCLLIFSMYTICFCHKIYMFMWNMILLGRTLRHGVTSVCNDTENIYIMFTDSG